MTHFLSDFKILRPAYEKTQDAFLDWLAKAHAKFVPQAEAEALYKSLLFTYKKIGIGPGKIEKRGVHCPDFLHEDWENMLIFRIHENSKGLGLKERMDFFKKSTDEVFSFFYKEKELPTNLIHVSCTGYTSPSGAQALVSEKKSLNTQVTNAFHMGCYASLPAIRIGSGFLKEQDKSSVDIVHTEICSLHMNASLHTKEQLVIESLFSDGFIKYSLKRAKENPSFQIACLLEEIIPDSCNDMEWICQNTNFSMHVSKEVPLKIAKHLPSYIQRLLSKASLPLEIQKKALFAIHPGGPKIIEQLSLVLNLSSSQVFHSHEILKSCGNMSSATLPHIWQKILEDKAIANKTPVISLAFGPGLTVSGSVFYKDC